MAIYVVGAKDFDTLDEARAYAVSRVNKNIYAIDVSKWGAHTKLYVGTVYYRMKKWYWKSNDGCMWRLNKDGTLGERIY